MLPNHKSNIFNWEGIDKLEIDNLNVDQKFKKFPDEIFKNYKVNKNIDKSIVLENKSNLIKIFL